MAETSIPAVRQITIGPEHAGQRVDNFLLTQLKGAPRTLVYRILRTGEVRVNKGRVKADHRLQEGDIVRVPPLKLPEKAEAPRPGSGLTSLLEGRILYEDNGLIVLNKPAGIAVHGGSGISMGVVEALRAMRPQYRLLELAHRLDRDTSGLLMLATKRSVLVHLHEQMRSDQMRKIYTALLAGDLKGRKHRVEAPLLKNVLASGERVVRVSREGKASLTEFTVQERFGQATLVEAHLHTGRTHQIRVHSRHLGHPVVGDDKYGYDDINKRFKAFGFTRLFLHARELDVRLPWEEKPMHFTAPLDEDFQSALQFLRDEQGREGQA